MKVSIKKPTDYDLVDDWEREINIIRGKAMAGVVGPDDLALLIEYVSRIEFALDEADCDDALGTEGWRHFCGVE